MSRMIYLPLPILILLLSMLSTAYAQRVQIFDIKKSLPMSSKETSYKDFYLSGGKDVGLRDNMIVTVYRLQPLHDYQRNEPRGELKLKVGQLKVIAAMESNAVARAFRSVSPKDAPINEFDSFFIGDVIDLTDAYYEKAKTAEADEAPAPTPKMVIELKAEDAPSTSAKAPADKPAPAPAPAKVPDKSRDLASATQPVAKP